MQLTIVLVLYKQLLAESTSYQSLLQNQALLAGTNLIIHDNSPAPQPIPHTRGNWNIRYRHAPDNPGLATAYNLALQDALALGHEWLLLLDQDTELQENYFLELFEIAPTAPENCVCVLPLVSDGLRQISPMNSLKVRASCKGISPGQHSGHITAINSGACWRTQWLSSIGGFNPDFPLDYLDHWAFHQVQRANRQLYILHCQITQSLSLSNRNQVSLSRYESIYESEYLFFSRYRTDLFSSYRRHLPIRFFKQLLLLKDKRVARKAIELMLRRSPIQ